MNAATERIEEMLRAREWSFERDEEKEMVNTGFNGKNAQWRVLAGGYNDFTVLILTDRALFPGAEHVLFEKTVAKPMPAPNPAQLSADL